MKWQEAALQWFNDLASQGILITDAELTIQGWNHWLEHHSGASATERIGAKLFDVYPDLVKRRLDEPYRDALAGRVSVISQRLHGYLLQMPASSEGSRFDYMQQSARIAPLVAEGEVIGTITIIEDVTERVARENHLVEVLGREKAARAEAEAANRAKDEFLAVVSHELRTPLNSIFGWVQILRAGNVGQDFVPQALEAIERSAKSQAKLIEDILDASRIISGKLRLETQPVDLAAIIKTALETVRPAAQAKAIHLKAILADQGEPVSGDPHRLQQIIWNLLFNAIKFTPSGGRIEVHLQTRNDMVELTVRDNGQGISPEFLPHVFDRFRQADSTSARRHGGLGLGLAIVRHLVELHGGTVKAESPGVGLGASFTVKFPSMAYRKSQDANASPAPQHTRSLASLAGQRKSFLPSLENLRVLVVDDDADSRKMMEVMLSDYGAQVKSATSAQEALDVLADWQADALISDIGMPDEDGYFLIGKIRALEPEQGGRIPAIAVTGYAGANERLRLLAAGYQLHITKPIELDELVLVVANLLGRSGQTMSD